MTTFCGDWECVFDDCHPTPQKSLRDKSQPSTIAVAHYYYHIVFQPPFGPRTFRHFLVCAMCWYGTTALLAEIVRVSIHTEPTQVLRLNVARIFIYVSALSFIVFIRACTALRGYEMNAHN